MTATRRCNVESAWDRDKHPWRTRPREQRREPSRGRPGRGGRACPRERPVDAVDGIDRVDKIGCAREADIAAAGTIW